MWKILHDYAPEELVVISVADFLIKNGLAFKVPNPHYPGLLPGQQCNGSGSLGTISPDPLVESGSS